jgi:hypothetical protein
LLVSGYSETCQIYIINYKFLRSVTPVTDHRSHHLKWYSTSAIFRLDGATSTIQSRDRLQLPNIFKMCTDHRKRYLMCDNELWAFIPSFSSFLVSLSGQLGFQLVSPFLPTIVTPCQLLPLSLLPTTIIILLLIFSIYILW